IEGAIGVDLGAESCRVAVFKEGEVIVITDNGRRRTPSVIAFDESQILFGETALKHAEGNRSNAIFLKDVQANLGRIDSMVTVNYKGAATNFSADEVFALMLRKMKVMAEDFLKNNVTETVISVPTFFSSRQRQGLKDAASTAGLNVIRVMNSASASAVAHIYRLQKTNQEEYRRRNLLVFDQGAGPSDLALFTECNLYNMTAEKVAADSELGGDCFTDLLVRHFVDDFTSKGQDLSDFRAIDLLRRQCEQAKALLSSHPVAHVEIHEGTLFGTITREQYANICEESFNKTRALIDRLLGAPRKMGRTGVHEILLVGRATQDPNLQNL
ncbi:hypothetical protein PENTCL1PPCAC_20799, partial [Pristionchus entomophagus]